MTPTGKIRSRECSWCARATASAGWRECELRAARRRQRPRGWPPPRSRAALKGVCPARPSPLGPDGGPLAFCERPHSTLGRPRACASSWGFQSNAELGAGRRSHLELTLNWNFTTGSTDLSGCGLLRPCNCSKNISLFFVRLTEQPADLTALPSCRQASGGRGGGRGGRRARGRCARRWKTWQT